MSWNTQLQVLANSGQLQRDFLHDFSTGNLNLNTTLVLPSGFPIQEQVVYYAGSGYVTYSAFANQATSAGSLSTNHVGSATWGIAVTLDGDGNIISPYSDQTTPGIFGTSALDFALTGNFKLNKYGNNNFSGPYVIPITAAGSHTIKYWLYGVLEEKPSGLFSTTQKKRYGAIGGPTPITTSSNLDYVKPFTINVYQKAVPITKSSTGTVLNGITTNMDTAGANTIALTKADNRGDNVASNWTIEKNVGGSWIAASAGVDYTISGTLTSDAITVSWILSGQYRIGNTATGTSSPSSGNNTSTAYSFFTVALTVIYTISFPTITPFIQGTVVSNNTTISNTVPVTGVENFQIDLSPIVNTNGSWITDTGVPVTETKTDAEWLDEINNRCEVRAVVKQGGVAVQTLSGFGPHTFTLPAGTYAVGYEIKPISNSIFDLNDLPSNV